MNPLLYKAHPLLWLTFDVLVHPGNHPHKEVLLLCLGYLAANFLWAFWLWLGMKHSTDTPPAPWLAYLLALPALILYLPLMLTLLSDVLAHSFQFKERFILSFILLVSSQMLTLFYAVTIRNTQSDATHRLLDGLAYALYMWLFSLPFGLAVIWIIERLDLFQTT